MPTDMGSFGLPGHDCLTRGHKQIFIEARDKDGGPDRRNVPWSPDNMLIDTVARLQRDLADMRAESQFLRTPGVPPVVLTPQHVAFTSTKEPQFAGTTSWEQYRQVVDAIVLSNGLDDAMATLQLLSHLEGDALNVALLVPVPRRASRMGLVDVLSEHRFAGWTGGPGEDPSRFAMALETLAVTDHRSPGRSCCRDSKFNRVDDVRLQSVPARVSMVLVEETGVC